MKYYYHIVPMLLMILLISGCSVMGGRQPTPTPPVPIETLLLERDLFPGWSVEQDESLACSVLGCGDELESISRQFTKPEANSKYDTIATQDIWRYSSHKQANKNYNRMVGNRDFTGIDTSPTQKISYNSTVAQNMNIHCHKIKPRVFCETIAQYGVYIVDFASYIDQDNMSYDDYERILAAIDKKMASVADVP